MKLFCIKYQYCWTKTGHLNTAAIIAEDFADAKKKLHSILAENCDIVGYMQVEAFVDKNNVIDFSDVLSSIREKIPEDKED